MNIEYDDCCVWALSEAAAREFFGFGPDFPACNVRNVLEPDPSRHHPAARVYQFDLSHLNDFQT